MTKIDISMETLTFLNIYAIMNDVKLEDIPVNNIINILNIYDIQYALIQCDEDTEVCLVLTKNIITGNIIRSDKECSICLEDYKSNNKIIKLECAHIFHMNCLIEAIKFKNSCPMCRKHIQIFLN